VRWLWHYHSSEDTHYGLLSTILWSCIRKVEVKLHALCWHYMKVSTSFISGDCTVQWQERWRRKQPESESRACNLLPVTLVIYRASCCAHFTLAVTCLWSVQPWGVVSDCHASCYLVSRQLYGYKMLFLNFWKTWYVCSSGITLCWYIVQVSKQMWWTG
jgi:hypothetical protein